MKNNFSKLKNSKSNFYFPVSDGEECNDCLYSLVPLTVFILKLQQFYPLLFSTIIANVNTAKKAKKKSWSFIESSFDLVIL